MNVKGALGKIIFLAVSISSTSNALSISQVGQVRSIVQQEIEVSIDIKKECIHESLKYCIFSLKRNSGERTLSLPLGGTILANEYVFQTEEKRKVYFKVDVLQNDDGHPGVYALTPPFSVRIRATDEHLFSGGVSELEKAGVVKVKLLYQGPEIKK